MKHFFTFLASITGECQSSGIKPIDHEELLIEIEIPICILPLLLFFIFLVN